MYKTQSQEDFKTLMRQKWSIVILNVIVFFIALAIFGVCIWIRFDLDFWEWVIEIDWYVIATKHARILLYWEYKRILAYLIATIISYRYFLCTCTKPL